MAKILITGGSGLVGTHLSRVLTKAGYQVVHLSRSVKGNEVYETYKWDVGRQQLDPRAFLGVDHLIHMAGAGVADKRWTDARKKVILDSRVEGLRLLSNTVRSHKISLKSFTSASAVGYYGLDTGDKLITEETSPGSDFLAEVVKAWEAAADNFEDLTRVAKVRIGVVLSNEGGALPAIAKPIKFFAGAPLGSGDQYVSWIHIDDLCGIFQHIIEKEITGTYNAVAPNPVTNTELTHRIAKILRKPVFLPNVPPFIMKVMLGEMSQVVLGGNKVSSEAIQKKGYVYQFTQLEKALADLLK